MNGKSKCKILKDIRKKIARENNIEYVTSECKFQGNCSGTCPKCEAEVRYLEQELAKRRAAGRAVAVAGVAAAMVVTAAGCDMFKPDVVGEVPYVDTESQEQWTGELGAVDQSTCDEPLEGDVPYQEPDETTSDHTMGRVPWSN